MTITVREFTLLMSTSRRSTTLGIFFTIFRPSSSHQIPFCTLQAWSFECLFESSRILTLAIEIGTIIKMSMEMTNMHDGHVVRGDPFLMTRSTFCPNSDWISPPRTQQGTLGPGRAEHSETDFRIFVKSPLWR